MSARTNKAQYITVDGKRAVVLEEAEYERLARKAEEWEPAMPEPNERGNYPIEALAVNLARNILRARRKLGLTQAELARRAGIRVQTLNRIEEAKNPPAVATVDKIDKALKQAEKEHARG